MERVTNLNMVILGNYFLVLSYGYNSASVEIAFNDNMFILIMVYTAWMLNLFRLLYKRDTDR
jgi:hypothetical protein